MKEKNKTEGIINFRKQRRKFRVTFLAEVYYEDGSESLVPMNRNCIIDGVNRGETETFEQLSKKLEDRLDELLPNNTCVNYIQDAEYVGVA